MKSIKIVLTCTLFCMVMSACKKEEVFFNTVNVSVYDPGVGVALNRISFASSSVGFISTANGKMLKTTDQGASWVVSALGTSDLNLQWLSTPSAQAIYVSGQTTSGDGQMFKSTDAGATWNPVNGNYDFELLDFPTAARGYMVSTGSLYRSTNSGSTWNYVNGLVTVDPQVMAFATNDTGVIVGFDGDSHRTTNGGTAVSQIYGLGFSGGSSIVYIKFVSATVGYAVDYRGGILKSTDAGETWSEVRYSSTSVGEDYGTTSIDGYETTVCAAGESTLLISKDGGATFNNYYNQQGLSIFDTFKDVAVVSTNKIIAVGSSGKIYTITF